MKKQIQELTEKWYRYVNKNHHKDRDCHFYIETAYSYGDKPTFTAYHEGYVAEPEHCPPRETYEEAEEDLLDLLKRIIHYQKEWVDRVLSSKEEWDRDQIEQAEEWYKLFYEEKKANR
jgi:hypothetical protein